MEKKLLLFFALFLFFVSAGISSDGDYHGYGTLSTVPVVGMDLSQLPGIEEVVSKAEESLDGTIDRSKLLVKDKRETFWRLIALPEGSILVAVIRELWDTGDIESIQLNVIHKTEGADMKAVAVAIQLLDINKVYLNSPLTHELSKKKFVYLSGTGQTGFIHVIGCTISLNRETCQLFFGWSSYGANEILIRVNEEDLMVGESYGGGNIFLSEGTHVFTLYAYGDGRRGALLDSRTVVVNVEVSGSISVEPCKILSVEDGCDLRVVWSARGTDAVIVLINGVEWTWAPANHFDSIRVSEGVYRFELYDEVNGGEKGKFLASKIARAFSESNPENNEQLDGLVPDDPGYRYQRFLKMIGMEKIWQRFGFGLGEGAKVGVADSGLICNELRDADGVVLALPHPDIDCGRVFMLYDAIDFDDNPGPEINKPNIGHHGTFVTAVMAARTNNGRGGSGIAPNATYFICRATDEFGFGSTFSVISCITKFQENGIDVVNLSLGSPVDDSFLRLGILNAVNSGMTIVAASGNDGGEMLFPAAINEVISVGSVDFDKTRSSYSNYGDGLDLVGVCGDLERNEFLGHGVVAEGFHLDQTVYRMFVLNGTSFCSTQVVGAIAVLYGLGFRAREAVDILFSGVEPLFDEGIGRGLLRLDRATGIDSDGLVTEKKRKSFPLSREPGSYQK